MSVPTHSLRITAAVRGPGAARPAVGRSRSRTGRRTGSRRCRAASRGTSSASSGCRTRCSRPRRSARASPGASTTCCACCAGSNLPAVEPIGIVTGRQTPDGEPLDPVLLTRHLQFSLPYRALFSQSLRADTATRLIDALAVLLVRLHLGRLLLGRRARSRTRCSAATPARSRRTSWTPRPATCTTRCRAGSASTTSTSRATNIAGELMDLAGRRPARRDDGPDRHRATSSCSRYRVAVGRAHRAGVVRARRALAGARADRAAQRPRLRRRRAQHQHRPGGHVDRDRAEGRRRRAPPAPAAAADRPRRRGEPGPPAAQRPRHLPRGHRPAGGRRGDRRPPVAEPELRADRARRPAPAARQAGAGRAVPRDPRAPLVPVRAARAPTSAWRRRSASYVDSVLVHKPDEQAVLGVDTQELPVVADTP